MVEDVGYTVHAYGVHPFEVIVARAVLITVLLYSIMLPDIILHILPVFLILDKLFVLTSLPVKLKAFSGLCLRLGFEVFEQADVVTPFRFGDNCFDDVHIKLGSP